VVGLSNAIGQFSLALAPGVFGLLHDATGSYSAMLGVCIALQLSATVMVVAMPRGRATSACLARASRV
jgi:cyanate permease